MAQYSRTFTHIGRQKRAAAVARRRQEKATMDEQDFQTWEHMLRTLVRLAAHHDEIHEDLRACVHEQRTWNVRQLEMNQRLKVIQARIESMLARMIAQGDNGQEA